METSQFIAQIIGLIYLALGIGLMLNPGYYKKVFETIIKDSSTMFLSGFLALVLGMCVLRVHNIWISDWRVVITIVGWLSVLKGILLLVFPRYGEHFKDLFSSERHMQMLSFLMIGLGGLFVYFGFFI